ncbi:hypothetical protein K3G39_06375 [Pontibacter sp. HSC-14F20]|uniref:hypothetical protein n=1 Tax=Pontibacter sp. HSC-14F20 TaxID=2864136 RepID=UPI001C72E250|nr:hypothetical protein [Pontibacter sp. HSC-14F20]MBX0332857.1 hypothetical protein [Pontibacter sp. HSC-14F20]
MMQEMEHWDEDRYMELNTYFRVKIQGMIDSDPYIQDLQKSEGGLQLTDLISRMSATDQERWEEFIQLDRIKLYLDMQNHLEGKGTPYTPRHGFGNSSADSDESPSPW